MEGKIMAQTGRESWQLLTNRTAFRESGVAVDITDVGKEYRTQRGETVNALQNINLTIREHDFICVVGSSGCGKTTLLNMMAGFEFPTSGTLSAGGLPITGPDPSRGVVFQKPPLYPWLTVGRNVEFGLKMQGMGKQERESRSADFLAMVGLGDAANMKPYEIARVLATDPDIILMDEPFGALDALTRENLQNELLRIWQERRKTIFFITHSVEEAVFLGNRVIVMSKHPGTIIDDINVDIRKDPHQADNDQTIRSNPEFVRLRDTITKEIHEQGL